jgi:CRISPR/Cas system endoribonuclease Cas6 (RAMP superfamily)
MKEKAEKGHAPPVKPIVLIPPFFGKSLEIEKDATLDVDVLFCGDFARYLPHVILGMNLFGKRGLYTQRYHGLNRFEVRSITCCFSHKKVYDGETIFLKSLKTADIKDIPYKPSKEITIGFKTPFTGMKFPPDFHTLLTLIRNRVIRFVNEYGNKEKVLPVTATGHTREYTEHYHKLERRSSRSRKNVFHSSTGVVTYDIDELNDTGAWMLQLGFIVGCGPDCSFGCGFLQKM